MSNFSDGDIKRFHQRLSTGIDQDLRVIAEFTKELEEKDVVDCKMKLNT